jgi:HEAT repeat protein
MVVRILAATLIAVSTVTAPTYSDDDLNKSDADVLRTAGIKPDAAAIREVFRGRIANDSEKAHIAEIIERLGSDSFRVRQQASADLERMGPKAIVQLRQATDHRDAEVARRARTILDKIDLYSPGVLAAAARMLGRAAPEGASKALLDFLPLAGDEFVDRAIRSGLVALALRDAKPDPAVMQALDDSVASRRAAAAEALIRAGLPEPRRILDRVIRDPQPLVRLATTTALITAARDRQAVPELIDLLVHLPANDIWRVEELLFRLGSETSPATVADTTPAGRLRLHSAWSKWWKENEATIDLSKVSFTPKVLGYKLITLIDRSGGTNGSVIELAPDGRTVRWKISGLAMPVHAEVLARTQRVLIADYNKNRVAEYDFQGRELWHKVVSQPLIANRLPNGNTFVAARSQLLEFDAAGNEVFRHLSTQSDIIGGQKTRDSYVYLTRFGNCVRIDRDGKVLASFAIGATPNFWGGLQTLPNGNILVIRRNEIVEFDPAGKQLQSMAVDNATTATRLSNGHTIVVSTVAPGRVVELDRQGAQRWTWSPSDGTIPWRASER